MNVANLKLCRELYELSGWNDTTFRWLMNIPEPFHVNAMIKAERKVSTSAYDLGYLLRKLPQNTKLEKLESSIWSVEDFDSKNEGEPHCIVELSTPEDAACKLAIELFKQGILTKEVA